MVNCILEKILKKEFKTESRNHVWQFIQFSLVGLSNTLINYIIYVILIYWGINYIAASIIGFFVSVSNAFYWNNKYVFKTGKKQGRKIFHTFLRMFIAYAGTGLILNNILLVLWIQIIKINKVVAPIFNLLIIIPLNFLLNKFWAFAQKTK